MHIRYGLTDSSYILLYTQVLNCGKEKAGSCHGGSHTGVHQFIHEVGFIPYDTCQTYIACSEDSTEGMCDKVDTTCSALNTCRTCDGFTESGGKCTSVESFPYATIKEYGVIGDEDDNKHHWDKEKRVMQIKKEIHTRGPVSASINGKALIDYMGGIFDDDTADKHTNHVVSM